MTRMRAVVVERFGPPEGMAIAKSKGKLRGKQPKLSACRQAHLVELRQAAHAIVELADCSTSPGPPSIGTSIELSESRCERSLRSDVVTANSQNGFRVFTTAAAFELSRLPATRFPRGCTSIAHDRPPL